MRGVDSVGRETKGKLQSLGTARTGIASSRALRTTRAIASRSAGDVLLPGPQAGDGPESRNEPKTSATCTRAPVAEVNARTEREVTTNTTSVVGASTPSQRITPPGTDDSVDPFVSSFHRLTPREVRSLVFVVIEGVGHGELGDALGISRGNVAKIMQSIRRKLAVPGHMDLQTFIQNVPSLATLVEAAEPMEAATTVRKERRQQDLLRVTINELQSVAGRARRRASNLKSFPTAHNESDAREQETSVILRVADVLDTAIADILREARRCGPTPDPTRR